MIRRGSIFWGGLLVLAGILLLLQNLGIITGNIWGIIWPLILIFFGVQFLFSVTGRGGHMESQKLALPVSGVSQAAVQFNHGAGYLRVDSSVEPGMLLSGTFEGGVECSQVNQGLTNRIDLRPGRQYFWDFPWSFGYHHGFSWTVGLNPDIPLMLEIKTGASETQLDLTHLKVTDLRMETGASSTTVRMPEAAGFTQAHVQSGVASVDIRIPAQVAARIEVKSGLAGISVDSRRFIQSGSLYESPDYASAANKVNLFVETGVGSVNVS
jgi:hypothetical protein